MAISFAHEEVLDRLSVPQRRTLFALSNLGYADRDHVRHVVGSGIDLKASRRGSLVSANGGQSLSRPRAVERRPLAGPQSPREIIDLRAGRVLGQLMVDGASHAGAIAVAHHDVDALAKIALEVISRTISALPIDTVGLGGSGC